MKDSRATASPWRLTTPPAEPLSSADAWDQPTRWEPHAGSSKAAQAAFAATELRAPWRAANDPAQPIGYRLDAQDHELLVSCDAADALQQQFDQHTAEFVAVHDLGTPFSRRLLSGVAIAGHRPLQRLQIRRRGSGETLAILHFLELPTSEGSTLRFYTTDTDAPPAVRLALTRTLLANAAMAAVMVSDRALQDPDPEFAPLEAALAQPPWPNRHWLLLPMQPDAALARQLANKGSDLAVRHGLQLLTTPVVNRPSEAWLFVHSSFTRLKNEGTLAPPKRQSDLFADAAAAPEQAAAAQEPVAANQAETEPAAMPPGFAARVVGPAVTAAAMPLTTLPATPPASASAAAPAAISKTSASGLLSGITAGMGLGTPARAPEVVAPPTAGPEVHTLTAYLQKVALIAGADAVCLFETLGGRDLAHVGQRPDPRALARHGSALLSAVGDASRGLGLGSATADLTISLPQHHLIVRTVPGREHLAIHLVLDRSASNLMLTRVQLQRLDDELVAQSVHAAQGAPGAAHGGAALSAGRTAAVSARPDRS